MFGTLAETLQNLLGSDVAGSVMSDIYSMDVMSKLNSTVFRTPHMRSAYFRKHFPYVEPVSVHLGRSRAKKERFAQYVPIKETLKMLLENRSVSQVLSEPRKGSRANGLLEDFCDGASYQRNVIFTSNNPSLQIMIYQDAFEVVNPLGSARKVHKVVGVYFTLANFAKHNRSTRDHLQLALLFNESDMRAFGHEKIFDPLIRDFADLEINGLTLNGVNIKGTVACILGDNLGSHFIGGFMENFSKSLYFCRYCLTTRPDFLRSPLQVQELRTIDDYTAAIQDIAVLGIPVRGIKNNSIFNELQFFHVCLPALPPCLAHDLFEGIIAKDLLLCIRYFVCSCKWFSYAYLNSQIASFPYKYGDANSKPPQVNEKGVKLSGDAIATWNLLRFFSVYIGHKVQNENDPVWILFLTLRKIVDIVTAPSLTEGTVAYLQVLIEEYIADRLELFPLESLVPKHHYLLHYPGLVLAFGPLINMWTMRFESKHSYFKNCVRQLKNFKSLCKTLAQRHQMLQAYLHSETFFSPTVSFNNSTPLVIQTYCIELQTCIRNLGITMLGAVVTDEVVYMGTAYTHGMFVALQSHDRMFGEILQGLVVNKESVFLMLRKYSGRFMSQFHYYEVSETSEYLCISVASLGDYLPLPLYNVDGRFILISKHSIFF
ncbi:unnamed protein product [Ixodes persulcatus]